MSREIEQHDYCCAAAAEAAACMPDILFAPSITAFDTLIRARRRVTLSGAAICAHAIFADLPKFLRHATQFYAAARLPFLFYLPLPCLGLHLISFKRQNRPPLY